MGIVFIVIQVIAALFLLLSVWHTNLQSNIKVNIYNLPTVLLSIVLMAAATYIEYLHILWFLPTGVLLAIIVWVLFSVEVPGAENISTTHKIIASLLSILLWNHVMIYLFYYFSNSKQIEAHEKFKP